MGNASRRPELLAPAGSPDALAAAIEGGADAVYFGGSLFSCRMRAKNFSEEDLRAALTLCRDTGVRSYLTLNARLRDGELEDALRLACFLWENGADGLIVSDVGLAARIRRMLPDFPLHASTQLSCASAADAAVLQTLGFSRMVCPRELSFAQIQALTARSPLGIEMFVHGAHCVSYSGQCMMSYALGGRSGNRGECAQPCRLPYTVTGLPGGTAEKFPLSLKDMSLCVHVPEILASGAVSLKIEGRQKSPDYVYGVTRMWRRLLDEGRAATAAETESLARLFSRQGFTDGYFTGCYRKMGGVRTEKDSASSRENAPFPGLTRTVPLSGVFTARPGEPVTLTLSDGRRTGKAAGEIPLPAEKQPLTADTVRDSLGKLGGTVFTLPEPEIRLADGLFLTRSALNALRRAALEDLRRLRRPAPRPEEPEVPAAGESAVRWHMTPKKIGVFRTPEQIPPSASDFFDEIRLPLAAARPGTVPVLPPIMTEGDEETVLRRLRILRPGRAVAHNFGQLACLASMGIEAVASFRFTAMNRQAAEVIRQAGASVVELSPELPAAAVRDIPGPKALLVYGRLPLMLTMRCVLSGGGDCCPAGGTGGSCGAGETGKSCRGQLRDRTGASFPVLSDGCRSQIVNSVPTYMGDRPAALAALGLDEQIFFFTGETRDEAEAVLRAHREGKPAPGLIRRIR